MKLKHEPSKMMEITKITHAHTRASISSGDRRLFGLYPMVAITWTPSLVW
jgi:hypothetical protein